MTNVFLSAARATPPLSLSTPTLYAGKNNIYSTVLIYASPWYRGFSRTNSARHPLSSPCSHWSFSRVSAVENSNFDLASIDRLLRYLWIYEGGRVDIARLRWKYPRYFHAEILILINLRGSWLILSREREREREKYVTSVCRDVDMSCEDNFDAWKIRIYLHKERRWNRLEK